MHDEAHIQAAIMSGREDGTILDLSLENENGRTSEQGWTLSIGRRDENDIPLGSDTYASRYHALLHQRGGSWWLEDCNSKNGTFIEEGEEEARVSGTIPLEIGQYFRIGRTWLRLQR